MGDTRTPGIAIAGDVDRWRSRVAGRARVVELPNGSLAGLDALVVASGANDPYALARRGLLEDVAVLYAAPFRLNHWQAGRLRRLSDERDGLLRYLEPFQHRPGFAFLRRLLDGREALWRPHYLRMLRLGLGKDDGIDELATEELAVCDALLDGGPRYVSASAAGGVEVGDVSAAFLTMHYEEGLVVQCTVSLAEGTEARQLVAVAPERTLVLDDLGPVASLRTVVAEAESPRPERLLAAPVRDPLAEEVRGFLDAVAAGDRSFGNAARWERVAGLWWAARQSMSFEEPAEVPLAADTEPPRLEVIEGGGGGTSTAVARPLLTVVSR